MLYRGTPQRYHAEFGVLLRYPSSSPPGHRDGEGAGDGGRRLTWRDLHLLYRLIGVSAGVCLPVHFNSGSCLWSAVAAFFLSCRIIPSLRSRLAPPPPHKGGAQDVDPRPYPIGSGGRGRGWGGAATGGGGRGQSG
ncbi:hypothetical protein Naga_100029g15 [Nannochloropsis gaditana]|uniref:Uncharacterized protein n=1 Tax=Nannochloropsis gaditana TaxID=72520 RepID=W7U8Z3_9STRA|nr:hypothetical protein Naga_100029g15 [Nannochloropsis gaditana]